MRPEEKLHRAIWSTLDEIAQEKLATLDDEWVLIDSHSHECKRAIQVLTKCGAIKIVKPRMHSYFAAFRALQEIQGVEEEPVGFYIDTIEPRYTEVLDFYYLNIGKHSDNLSDDTVAKVTAKLKEWQGSKPVQIPSAAPAIPANRTQEKKIEKLIMVENQKHTSKLTVIVNDDYQKPLYFNTHKPTGGFLLKLAQEETPLPLAEHKQSFDYLNGDKSQLITETGCTRTKILHSEAGYIEPTIVIERITEKVFKQRSGKSPKKT